LPGLREKIPSKAACPNCGHHGPFAVAEEASGAERPEARVGIVPNDAKYRPFQNRRLKCLDKAGRFRPQKNHATSGIPRFNGEARYAVAVQAVFTDCPPRSP
jgi:hypothetical protein